MPGGEDAAQLSPERMSPADMSGRLVESEHRGRYWWSAPLAADRDVLDAGCGTGYGSEILAVAGARRVVGLDMSEDAIAAAREVAEHEVIELVVGTLHALPFPDASFDLAVCFEVIEHLEQRELAIAELRRVLRPDGVLAVSSPNRGVYPPGNPHHVHEFRPRELSEALAAEFACVRLYRQSPWLAAAVLDDAESRATGAAEELSTRVIKITGVEPGGETFSLALASAVEVQAPQSLVALGDPFELRWWHEQVEHARTAGEAVARAAEVAAQRQAAAETARQESEERTLRAEARAAELETALRESQERGGRAGARAAELAARGRAAAETAVAESGRALLAVETELALARDRIASLEASRAGLQQADLFHENDELDELRMRLADLEPRVRRAEQTVSDMNGSLSWQLTKPLRDAKRRLGER